MAGSGAAAGEGEEADHGEAADARAICFLRDLLGEGERVNKETLRPQIELNADGFYLIGGKGELKQSSGPVGEAPFQVG